MKWPRWTRNPASGVSLPGRSRRQSWLRTTLLRPLYFCARGYVQVEISATICRRPVRSEEQRLAVGSDVSVCVAKRAVDRRAEIHRLRPGVIHRLARRHEQVVVPDSSPVREKEQLESVKANDCTLVVPRSIELRDQLRISKRSVSHSFAYVDVEQATPAGSVAAEEEKRTAAIVVLEEARALVLGPVAISGCRSRQRVCSRVAGPPSSPRTPAMIYPPRVRWRMQRVRRCCCGTSRTPILPARSRRWPAPTICSSSRRPTTGLCDAGQHLA